MKNVPPEKVLSPEEAYELAMEWVIAWIRREQRVPEEHEIQAFPAAVRSAIAPALRPCVVKARKGKGSYARKGKTSKT